MSKTQTPPNHATPTGDVIDPPCHANSPRTPLPTIRARCLDCRGESARDVRECRRTDCPLWEYRMGRRPAKGTAKRTPMQALRAFCMWCCLNQPTEVRLCPAKGCPSWPFRLGKRPKPPSPHPDEIASEHGGYAASSDANDAVSEVLP